MTPARDVVANGRPLLVALLDELREPIFALDEHGTIVHANLEGARRLGRLRTHLIGKPFSSLLELDSRRAFRAAFAHADVDAVDLDVQITRVGPAALTLRALPRLNACCVTVRAPAPAPVPAPAPAPAPGVTVEVTHTLERFFLRFPFGVVGLRPDRRVAFANPRARHLLGSIRVGNRFVPPPAYEDVVERVLAPNSGLQSTRVELEDGRVIRVTGTGGSRNQPAVLMLEDVTRSRREMDAMYAFVRNAAHQLRTPLTSIATAVEVLQAGAKEDPEQRDRFLSHIDEHATRLVRIARGLLVLARAQSGEPPRLDLVRLEPLLTELAAVSAPAPGVRIAVDCAPELDVLAEPDLIREAVAALVDNAVRHTTEGRIEIAAAPANSHVAISVTDEGGGVLPEYRARLFDPFYQPIPSSGGFGLGLAIAAQAVHAMDGALTVDDVRGGARFTITLPSATKAL